MNTAAVPASLVVSRRRLSIATRVTLIVLCSALTVVAVLAEGFRLHDLIRLAALIAIGCLAVAATGRRPQNWWILVAESALVALLVMTAGGPHEPLLPYLLAPALEVGLLAGVRGALTVAGSASAMVLLARAADVTDRGVVEYSTTAAQWVLLALATGTLAAWARRFGLQAREPDHMYVAAYRLVSQLRTVARHLSGGLDAVSLGEILLQDLRAVTDFDRGAVFVAGTSGALMPIARHGDIALEPAPGGDNVLNDVWNHQQATVGARGLYGRPGRVSVALPLTVGARTIGVVGLERRTPWEPHLQPQSLMPTVNEAALRIETALLFSEVRSIATAAERKRLAREIHDGIAQELAFLGYVLDDLAVRTEQADIRGELKDLRQQVTRVVGDLRLSIFELRSEVQEHAGLGAVLSDYTRSVGAASSMTVHLVLDEAPQRLPVEAETELLRIAQESITNARKHAQAENLWVTCRVQPPTFELVVEDDGRGTGEARTDSFGLQIMRERAERLGAYLSITERPGGGTRVEIVMPSKDAPDALAGKERRRS